MAGAPEGNRNSNLGNRLWANTIRRAVLQSDAERLRRIAEAMLAKAEEGDMVAIKEMGDRLDGKPISTLDADVTLNGTMEHKHISVHGVEPSK